MRGLPHPHGLNKTGFRQTKHDTTLKDCMQRSEHCIGTHGIHTFDSSGASSFCQALRHELGAKGWFQRVVGSAALEAPCRSPVFELPAAAKAFPWVDGRCYAVMLRLKVSLQFFQRLCPIAGKASLAKSARQPRLCRLLRLTCSRPASSTKQLLLGLSFC